MTMRQGPNLSAQPPKQSQNCTPIPEQILSSCFLVRNFDYTWSLQPFCSFNTYRVMLTEGLLASCHTKMKCPVSRRCSLNILQLQSGQVWEHILEQCVAASTFRWYSRGLHLAIPKADAMPIPNLLEMLINLLQSRGTWSAHWPLPHTRFPR